MTVAIGCMSRGHGGLELYALREHRELTARGIRCVSVVARDSMLARQLAEQNLQPEYLNVNNRRLPLIAARKLARLLDEQRVDVLHIHWNKDLNLAVLAKIFTRRKIRLVYTRHMDITRSKRDVFHRFFYSRVDLVLTISNLVTRDCRRFLPMPPEKIQLLYLGVAAPESEHPDCQAFFSDSFKRRNLNVACFGRMEPYKAQHVLVKTAESLVSQGLDVSVTIIGHVMDKEYAEDLKTGVVDKQLTPYIQFIDFVDNPIELMGCFDIVVLTTMQETFGLVLVEAMRAGVAVIGTNAGGVPDIVEHGRSGLLTEPGSVSDLARAVRQLYDDPDKLGKLAAAGKARADEHFAEDMHFDRLKSVLQGLAN